MTGVSSYSTTASENVAANTGITWDEGMQPANVNNSARQNMADMRLQWNDAAWFLYGNSSKTVAHNYASSTSTTIATDVTTYWHAGRRVKAVGSGTGTIYGKVASSSYSAPNTTINYTWDSGSLSNETLTIYASITPVTGAPIPVSGIGNLGSGVGTLLAAASSGTGGIVGTTSPTITSPTVTSPTISSGALTFGTQGNIRYAAAAEGSVACTINGSHTGNNQHFFYDFASNSANNTATCYYVGQHSSTSRSINAGGTINASGADYAEYETKSPTCGTVSKGQIIGFDATGHVTDKWADAVSFGIKSTNPSYVGGDVWGNNAALGERPLPPDQPELDPERAGYDEGRATEYRAALAAYELDRAEYDTRLEAARQTVDRIAYSGKVPVNVTGAAVGDYIVASADGDGIGGLIVTAPSFDQYRSAVGRVRNILPDGRAVVAVMVH